ncbi:RecQ family ATP-dependent DNA helicase [Limosilactobacillus difficilis]|uniref:RecQ family ATP-dependent DNA helicase n=1 Tax=Limosilactobacillus difficilis TaxID=2991838 RepID=UPI0024B914DE|nr:RecQ family ATP-dependent DNA helicase [Limosilactobacillus difficilis]
MVNDAKLLATLRQHFGFNAFRPGQLATLRSIMAQQDTLAILPTGAGKTLLYQLPAYLLKGTIIVVSPLLSLMQDQENRLRLRGEKRVVVLSSLLTMSERIHVLTHLNSYHYIFVSPEMLARQDVEEGLARMKLALLVIDEAHCISQWGPDFRPEYLLLGRVIRSLGHPTTLMLTATASRRVADDICQKLSLTHVTRVVRSIDRPNIFLAVEQCDSQDEKQGQLLRLVKKFDRSGVIYFSSRKIASEVANFLANQTKLRVAAYHAGVASIDRYRIQQQFMQEKLDVICATSAFGMGIDKNNIRYVIHYHFPPSLTSYVQEIGRAGRDGKQSAAVLLYSPGDEQLALNLKAVELPSVAMMNAYRKHQVAANALGRNATILTFYLDHGWQPERIVAYFQQRWQLAQRQVQEMLAYIRTGQCKREFMLTAFGEPGKKQPVNWCCSADQKAWQEDLVLPVIQPTRFPVENDFDWQKRLRQLFF